MSDERLEQIVCAECGDQAAKGLKAERRDLLERLERAERGRDFNIAHVLFQDEQIMTLKDDFSATRTRLEKGKNLMRMSAHYLRELADNNPRADDDLRTRLENVAAEFEAWLRAESMVEKKKPVSRDRDDLTPEQFEAMDRRRNA